MALLPPADPLDEETLTQLLGGDPRQLLKKPKAESGPVIRKPQVESPSVLDSTAEKAWKAVQRFLGGDDAASQVMGIAAPMEVAPASGPVAKALDKLLKRIPNPIKAYHGSPHDFDRFDISKTGTGEGASAYGQGLYFAENPNVAEEYRRSLARPTPENPEWRLRGEPIAVGTPHWSIAGALEGAPKEGRSGDMTAFLQKRIQELDEHAKFAKKVYGDDTANMYVAQADKLRSIRPGDLTHHQPGRTYEVNIHADPKDLLDWDAPLSQQSEKVQKQLPTRAMREWDYRPENLTGAGLLNATRGIARRFGGNKMAEDILKERGIPGIKYLDQMSRGAKEGTRNFVMFDDKLIEIVKKYGIAGAVSAGLINQAQAAQMQQQGYE